MVMGSSSDGAFEPARQVLIGPEPIQIEAADFDRDGRMDLAILGVGTDAAAGLEYAQSLYVLQGDGEGGFVEPYRNVFSTTDSVPHFAVGDLDGDGWKDLALYEGGLARIRLARGAAAPDGPAFEPWGPGFDAGGAAIGRLASGDLDGDGSSDLILARDTAGGGEVGFHRVDAGGVIVASPGPALPFSPSCVAVAPIDGDDAPEVVIGGRRPSGAGEVAVLRGRPGELPGLDAPASASLVAAPAELAVGQMDGAGLRDIVLVLPEATQVATVLVTESSSHPVTFIRGDTNGDGRVDIADAVRALDYLFGGWPGADCMEAFDIDDSRNLNVTDPIYLLNHLFLGGPEPPAPYPEPGTDPGPSALGCDRT